MQAALVIRGTNAEIDRDSGLLRASFQGVATRSAHSGGLAASRAVDDPPGQGCRRADEVVIDERLAAGSKLAPGSDIVLRASCDADLDALPAVRLKIVGVAEFPFQATSESTTGELRSRSRPRAAGTSAMKRT